jgi:hypothetical protein
MGLIRPNLARLVAVAAIVALYTQVNPPALSGQERAALSGQFHFTRFGLPEVPGFVAQHIRQVNPSLGHIAGWISSVGAAVALNDIDGDGLSNDLCYVDTRTNQIVVAPVPGTLGRFAPFVLDAAPLPYDPATMAPMGCLPGDLNEDGALDLLAYYWGRTPVAFLRQAAHGAPLRPPALSGYTPREIVPEGGRWFTNAATIADLDGDGHADLVIGNYFQDGARILDTRATSQEQMQDSMSRAFNGGHTHLLLWHEATAGATPSVGYRQVAGALPDELSRGWTLAIGAADLDGDLLPELYLANDFGPDRLLYNQSRPGELRFTLLEGQKTLTSPGSKVLGHDSFKGMGVDFGDLNGDGRLDMFVSNIATNFGLQESNFAFVSTGEPIGPATTRAPFEDRSEALGLSRSGWGWEARLADFNNDGTLEALQAVGFVKGATNRWPELHELAMGNDALLRMPASWLTVLAGDDIAGHQPNPFYVRAANDRYYDLAADLDLSEPYASRGIATADVDGDGRLDYAVANQWGPSSFYRNNAPDAGAYLGLHLLLPAAGQASAATAARPGHPAAEQPARAAIGAGATVLLPDGRRLVAQVDGGNGHSGKRGPELHFGLGRLDPAQPLTVDLSWRDGDGKIHQEQLELTPGWHTVVLGS